MDTEMFMIQKTPNLLKLHKFTQIYNINLSNI